jgi:hypothetical protein
MSQENNADEAWKWASSGATHSIKAILLAQDLGQTWVLYLGCQWRRSHHKTWHARRSMLHHQCTDQNSERVPTDERTPESRQKPFEGARPPSRCTWSNSNETKTTGNTAFKTRSFSASEVNKMEPIPREHHMRHSQYQGRKREKKIGLVKRHPEIATSVKS